MKTSGDGSEIRIEKEGYAPIISRRNLRVEDNASHQDLKES